MINRSWVFRASWLKQWGVCLRFLAWVKMFTEIEAKQTTWVPLCNSFQTGWWVQWQSRRVTCCPWSLKLLFKWMKMIIAGFFFFFQLSMHIWIAVEQKAAVVESWSKVDRLGSLLCVHMGSTTKITNKEINKESFFCSYAKLDCCNCAHPPCKHLIWFFFFSPIAGQGLDHSRGVKKST